MKKIMASLLLVSSVASADSGSEMISKNVINNQMAYAKILLGRGPLTQVEDREEFSSSERHGFTLTPARLRDQGCIVREVSFTSKQTGEIRHAVYFMQGEKSLVLALDKKANTYYSYAPTDAQIKVDASGNIAELNSKDISCKDIRMEDQVASRAEKYSCTLLSESYSRQTKADLADFGKTIPNMDISFLDGFAAIDVHYDTHSFRHRFHNRKGIIEPVGSTFYYLTKTSLEMNSFEVAGAIEWDSYNRSQRSSNFEFSFNRRTKLLTTKDASLNNGVVDAATYKCR